MLPSKPLRQTRKRETPMIKYKKIQTGAKTQPGGVKKGFSRSTYQIGMDLLVKKEPTMPAAWHIVTLAKSLSGSSFKILSLLKFMLYRSPWTLDLKFCFAPTRLPLRKTTPLSILKKKKNVFYLPRS